MEPTTTKNKAVWTPTVKKSEAEDNSVPAGLPTDKGLPTNKQFRESEETWTKLNQPKR